ncbi:MAG: Ig-like domain-containing protein [Gammaproteobacteria bacterium]
MNKTFFSLVALAALTFVSTAQAFPVKLVSYHQLSGTTVSTLRWDGCTNYAVGTNCIKPGTFMGTHVSPSTAVWDWNPATGVLSSVGNFNAASSLSSNADAPMVIGDSVTDLVLNTVNSTTAASAYTCIEGNFLAGVGANGCANTSLGANFVDESSVAYNVGGNANCVVRTLGGDDVSTGGPRTLTTTAGGGGCDAGDGAFDIWTVVSDNTGTGGQLTIATSNDITTPNGAYLIFDALPHAVDDTANALPTVATSIDVLANDVALTDPVTLAIATPAGKGTATITGTNPGNMDQLRIEYTADVGATGTDTFEYTATSGATTSTATVTVTILQGGANDDTGATTRNKPVTINVGGNDTGFTGDVTITQVGSCDQGGTFAPGADGPAAQASITYTPATTAAGSPTYTEVCTYQITDGTVTDSATVTVTVSNTVPVAGPGSIGPISTVGVNPNTKPGTINVAAISGNNLGDPTSTVTASGASKGTVTVAGTTVTYTPNATFFAGTDQFDYVITDGDPGTPETATGTVTVTIADATPALADLSVTTTAGLPSSPRALTVTAGNGALAQHTFAVTTNGAGGSCSLNSSNTAVTYTPNTGFTGADSCVITVTDGDGSTATGTTTVMVDAAPSTGGGVGGGVLPGGSSALDIWSLALLGMGAWLRRKRKVS